MTRGSMVCGGEGGQQRYGQDGRCVSVPLGVKGNAFCARGFGLKLQRVSRRDGNVLVNMPWSTWMEKKPWWKCRSSRSSRGAGNGCGRTRQERQTDGSGGLLF